LAGARHGKSRTNPSTEIQRGKNKTTGGLGFGHHKPMHNTHTTKKEEKKKKHDFLVGIWAT
jgi:hypothetical protein